MGEDRYIVRLWLAFIAMVLACLGAPALAAATDRYVAKTGNDGTSCADSSNPCLTIGHAVTAANTSGDTIHIGAGTYDEAIATTKSASFVGAGSGTLTDTTGATVVDGSPEPAFQTNAGGSFSNLRAIGGPTNNPTAIELQTPSSGAVSYTLTAVVAIGNDCSGCRALEVRNPSFGDPSLLTLNVSDSTFVSTGDTTESAFVQSANATFTRTSLLQRVNPASGLLMEFGTLNFTDGTVGSPGFASSAGEVAYDVHATFTRTRFNGQFGLRVDGSMGPAEATIEDSLVSSAETALTVVFGSTLNARNSTFVAEGSGAQTAADLEAGTAGDAVMNSTNSIFRAGGGNPGATDVRLADGGAHTATFSADHSNYTAVISGGASATPAGSGSNIAGPPDFVNETGGDFHLAAGSPLIDRGAPAAPGETDLDGSTRAIDAGCGGTPTPDIGAFEFVRTCAQPPIAAAPPVPPALSHVRMTHRRFRVGGTGAARAPKGTRFVYTLSEPAKVTITIERRAAGRKKGRRCVTPRRGLHKRCIRFVRKGALSRQSAAGPSSVPFSGRIRRRALSPGRYQARLVAVNADGRSKQRRLNFAVVRR